MTGPPSPARDTALEALLLVERGEGFLRDVLHEIFRRESLSSRDRALALQLAAGAIRHRRTLRLVLSHLRGREGGAEAIQPDLLAILEIGVFQILFLDRVPPHAAVNEAVEAARRRKGSKAGGFVNAMLRNTGRLIRGREPQGEPCRRALPHPEGGVVLLASDVLPDPEADRAVFLGAAYSYPDWLTGRWLRAFGGKAEALCQYGNRRPHTYARVNRMRHDPDDLVRHLKAEGVQVAAGPRTGSLDVSSLEIGRLESLLAEGSLTVQDPSAMAAVEALAPMPGETVLDLCASPGTKTMQIVEAMGGQGQVVACDVSESKLEPLRRACEARDAVRVKVCLAAEVEAATPQGGFDAVLVDAPCSNTGVLARRVEVRWRLRPEDIGELGTAQRDLLAQAGRLVRAGGRLVYSTCSLEREENEEAVEAFRRDHAGWHRDGSEAIVPGPDHDGAYWARLRRS